jgi:hypothetical protein
LPASASCASPAADDETIISALSISFFILGSSCSGRGRTPSFVA